jgi:hypothetical protein
MPGTFYLALSAMGLTGAGLPYDANKNRTTTLELTDGLNYSVDDANGWAPAVPMLSDQTRVIETITVNILGKTVAGGPDDSYLVRRNKDRLLLMLRQIVRGMRGVAGDGGEGSPVTLTVGTPNSNPGMRVRALLLGWDSSTFLPPDYNSARSLTTNTVEQVTLILERRHPWTFVSYLYPNLLTSSAWSSNPGWSAGTYVNDLGAGGLVLPYGGRGYLSAIPASSTTTAPAGTTFDITNGQTYTIVFTASMTAGSAALLQGVLRNSANSADVSTAFSSAVTVSAIGSLDTAGQRYSATVTATATASNVRLRFSTGAAASTFNIGEVLIMAGSATDEVWHPTDTEHTSATTSSAASPTTSMTATWPTAISRTSPVDLVISPYANNSNTYAGEGAIIWTSGMVVSANLTGSGAVAPFSAVAGTNAPGGGNVLRYTPAGTAQVEMPVDILHYMSHYQIWAKIRNTSATTTFQIQPAARSSLTTASLYRVYGDKALIGPQTTTTSPYVVKLGEMQHSERLDTLELFIEASAASGALDITDLWLIEMVEASGAIKHGKTNTTGLNGLPVGIRVLSNWMGGYTAAVKTGAYPMIEAADANTLAGLPIETADLPLVTMRGDTLKVIWLGVSDTSWVQRDSAGGAVTISMTATRLPAYDTPY